jgi:hypothetical protein
LATAQLVQNALIRDSRSNFVLNASAAVFSASEMAASANLYFWRAGPTEGVKMGAVGITLIPGNSNRLGR